MSIIEAISMTGLIGARIAVPVLRILASVLLAFAVSGDCKSRDNGSSALWGLLTLLSPVFFGIFYFVYSRFFTDRKPETQKDKRVGKRARVLCTLSILTYLTMVVVLVISVILSVSSGVAGALK